MDEIERYRRDELRSATVEVSHAAPPDHFLNGSRRRMSSGDSAP